MSRLTIPDSHLRPPAEPAELVEPEEPKVALTHPELEKLLLESEDSGFKRGVLEGEKKARGAERAELEEQLTAVAEQESRLAAAFRDISTALQSLEARNDEYNKTLEAALDAAACAMAARLLIEVNQSKEVLADLMSSLRQQHRISGMSVFVSERLRAALGEELNDHDDIHIRAADTGDALSIRIETETGELRYSLRDIATDLHRQLLERSDAID